MKTSDKIFIGLVIASGILGTSMHTKPILDMSNPAVAQSFNLIVGTLFVTALLAGIVTAFVLHAKQVLRFLGWVLIAAVFIALLAWFFSIFGLIFGVIIILLMGIFVSIN